MEKSVRLLLVVVMLGVLVSSCTNKKDIVLEGLDPNREVTIKVLYYTENAFWQKYGNLFMSKFPNITVEVIEMVVVFRDPELDFETALRNLIVERKPDVLLLGPIEYEEMARNGELYELSGVIVQEQFDLDGFLPSVLDLLKEKGDGRLYGLAPTFRSEALFYNIDLFHTYGIELPRNGMTWEEVFQLAAAFPRDGDPENRIYGIHRSRFTLSHFTMIKEVGKSYGLSYVDLEEGVVTFNTEGWRKSYELVVDALKSGVIYYTNQLGTGGKMEEIFKDEMFTMGRAAMTVTKPGQIGDITAVTNHLKGYEPFDWGVVTIPVDPMSPTINMFLNEIYAIHTESNELRAAWELVKYINSEEMAKIQGKTFDGNLLTRTEFIEAPDQRDISAFYSLQPDLDDQYFHSRLPSGFYGQFSEIVERETEAVLAGEKSIEDALRAIQEDGQKAYDWALEEQREAVLE